MLGFGYNNTVQIELIVRALIVKDKKILVCRTKGREYFFLPGGHVEFAENLKEALRRELFEELGVGVNRSEFIGGVENLFSQEGIRKHEISFIFLTDISTAEVNSKENHVEFFWFGMDEFINSYFVPPAMKDAIIEWTAEKEPFFIEEGTNR